MEINGNQLPRRVHYKVDQLPENIKDEVVAALKNGTLYEQISNDLQKEGYFISKSSIGRYYKLLQRLGKI